MMPASPSAWNASSFELVSNRLKTLSFGSGCLDSGDDGLLLRLVDEPCRVERIGLLTKWAAGWGCHAPSVCLMPKHRARRSLRDLLALQFGERREQGEDEPAHRRARVDGFLNHGKIGTGRVQSLGQVDGVLGIAGEPGKRIDA